MAEPPPGPFLAALRRSRLLSPAELDSLTAKYSATTARELADRLVHESTLTHYQADKLLRGRWQGLVLGPYSVLAPLGRGGMGTVVYLARDRRVAEQLGDSDLLALKLLPDRNGTADPKALARFRREMEFGCRVSHPRVVRMFAAGEMDGVHFIAMEFVPGVTLRQHVVERGPMGVGDAARMFADVADGLAHIHDRSIVHRDVKPGNVMVKPDGRAVLLDLGLAYLPGEVLPADPTIVGGRGYTVGTMDYLAPEQARDASAVGPAADLYGLGCALVFALTGAVPFPAVTTKEKVQRHRTDPPPELPNVPVEFRRIVYQLLEKSPSARPASAAAVRDLLSMWATASQPRSVVDAVTLADTPGADAGLWDATPGDDIPKAVPLEEIPDEEPPRKAPKAGCAGVFLLLLAALVLAFA